MQELRKKIRELFTTLPLNVHKHFLPDDPQDMYQKFRWVLACGLIMCPEYRFQSPRLTWANDAEFTNYLKKFDEIYGLQTYRRWDLYQTLRLIAQVPGDTAEAGCFTGAASYLILRHACMGTQKRHHVIFDSFEGLSEPTAYDGSHWKTNALSSTEEILHKNLEEFSGKYTAYKGWIPERFCEVASHRFAFVHIDVDLYEPTKDSIEFFYPRMSKGGIIVCDDYGSTVCPGATKAIDEYMRDKPEIIMSPSSGAGYFIKL